MAVKYRATLGPTYPTYYLGVKQAEQILPGTIENIETYNHNLRFLGQFDCGGPMLLQRDNHIHFPGTVVSGNYAGTQLVIQTTGFGPAHPAPPSDFSQWGTGATAISRSLPTAPTFSGVTALRELRADGLPSIPGLMAWRDRVKNIRNNAGSEYLNVQFGWLPLINEIKGFCQAVTNHNKVLQDLRDGSRKVTRVGYHFPEVTTTFSDNRNVLLYGGGDSGWSNNRPAVTFASQTTKIWFNGAFRYYLPVSDSQFGKAALYASYAKKLLGVEPTPEALWNSSPWTWGVDWFTNAGDVLANISNLGQDGLALLYGYLMTHTKTESRVSHPGGSLKSYSSIFTNGSTYRIRETKKRMPAHPYGFGVSDGDLSSTQKAVIGALGLTRFPRR